MFVASFMVVTSTVLGILTASLGDRIALQRNAHIENLPL